MRMHSLMLVVGVGMFGCGGSSETAPRGEDGPVDTTTTGSGGSPGGSGGSGGAGTGGTPVMGSGGAGGTIDAATMDTAGPTDGGSGDVAGLPNFSFFVASREALVMLSGNPKGFGGDFRFGKPDGLTGADEICRRVAEMGMPGAGQKTWRAFLSVTAGPGGGGPVNAIDRIGNGPWYDRIGRLVAMTKADLAQNRPRNGSPIIINDLPNETGVPNGHPVAGGPRVDNHHTLTGSSPTGTLNSMNKSDTCQDWTSSAGSGGRPRVGLSWPRFTNDHWISWGFEGGCAPGFNLVENAAATEGNMAVGSNGGYGGFYCMALQP